MSDETKPEAELDPSDSSPSQRIAAGYATDDAALELGTVVVDGKADPTAKVPIPLAMMNRHGLIAGATGRARPRPSRSSPSSCRQRECPW